MNGQYPLNYVFSGGGGRHVKKFHLKLHLFGGVGGSVEDVGVSGAEDVEEEEMKKKKKKKKMRKKKMRKEKMRKEKKCLEFVFLHPK